MLTLSKGLIRNKRNSEHSENASFFMSPPLSVPGVQRESSWMAWPVTGN